MACCNLDYFIHMIDSTHKNETILMQRFESWQNVVHITITQKLPRDNDIENSSLSYIWLLVISVKCTKNLGEITATQQAFGMELIRVKHICIYIYMYVYINTHTYI
jgi:hypothetical protein